jgi:tryptophan synthase beta chain
MPLEKRQVNLSPDDIPRQWYNLIPDLPEKMELPPPRDPDEGPSRINRLPKILVGECLNQEMSRENWIDIPEEIWFLYQQIGRPRPLFRAKKLEEKLQSPARLYWKGELFSPTGSHKVNTAIAQAYYAKQQGFERVTTETGAGQWGSALSLGASLNDIKCTVFWVRAVYNWKPDRKNLMELLFADTYPSPSARTEYGKKLVEMDPNHPGSLGIAISEGIEDALGDERAAYCLGSVLNHVLLHQTINGLETQKQFEIFDDYPDIMISCIGGGSNFGGFVLPFMGEVLRGEKDIRFLAAQSQAAPNLQGEYRYDFADVAEMTPMLKMCTLGHKKEMSPIKGDGLRYHGCSPLLSLLRHHDLIDTVAYPTNEIKIFEAARIFFQTEGFLPAPESAYSVACAMDEAIRAREEGTEKVIAFNVSGHGFLDVEGYKEVLKLGAKNDQMYSARGIFVP